MFRFINVTVLTAIIAVVVAAGEPSLKQGLTTKFWVLIGLQFLILLIGFPIGRAIYYGTQSPYEQHRQSAFNRWFDGLGYGLLIVFGCSWGLWYLSGYNVQ